MEKYLISSDGYAESFITDDKYSRVVVTKDIESIKKAIEYWLEDMMNVYKPESIKIEEDEIKFLVADDWDCYNDSAYWTKTFHLHKIVEI
jgi:hypothetical protein